MHQKSHDESKDEAMYKESQKIWSARYGVSDAYAKDSGKSVHNFEKEGRCYNKKKNSCDGRNDPFVFAGVGFDASKVFHYKNFFKKFYSILRKVATL